MFSPPRPQIHPIPFALSGRTFGCRDLWVGGGEEGHRAPCSCGIRVLTFPTQRFAVPGAGAATQRVGGSGAAFRVGGERGRPLCPGRCAGGCAAPWPRRSPSCRAPALCSRVRRLSGVGKGPGESFWGLRESFRAPAAIPTNQSRGCRERGLTAWRGGWRNARVSGGEMWKGSSEPPQAEGSFLGRRFERGN